MAYTAQTFNTSLNTPTSGPKLADGVWLKVWSGEVMKEFLTQTVMRSRHRVKTIKNAKSYQFPAIGRGTAGYHQPGQGPILGQAVTTKEKVITVDDLLVTTRFLSNYEEALTHFDTRAEHTKLMGDELAQVYDQHMFGLATKTCVDGVSNVMPEWGSAQRAAIGTTPTITNIVDQFYEAAKYFDGNNIPKDGRVAFVEPQTYWDMIKDGAILDRDFGNTSASQQNGGSFRIAGIEIVVTNNLALDFGTDTLQAQRNGAAFTGYDTDGSNSKVLFMQREALASVHLMDVSSESKYQMEYQGTLMLSKMAVGHDVLRPECLYLVAAE